MVGEVPRCLTMKAAVHHDTHLVSDPLWHIQPMKLIVEEWRQATIKLPCVTDHTGGSIEHSLQFVDNRPRRPCIDCVTIVDARRDKSMHEGCRRSIVEWLPGTTKLTKPMEADCTRLGDMLLETQVRRERYTKRPYMPRPNPSNLYTVVASLTHYTGCSKNIQIFQQQQTYRID